jgi:hypothetical protein
MTESRIVDVLEEASIWTDLIIRTKSSKTFAMNIYAYYETSNLENINLNDRAYAAKTFYRALRDNSENK